MGYQYLDVIQHPQKIDLIQMYSDTKIKVLQESKLQVSIDFRDWKWLSQHTRFKHETNDTQIINGEKEGSIMVDFSKMSQSDSRNESKYEVAGRMYYEAHAFGYHVSSFTSAGFLDRQGYKIPKLESTLIDFLH